MFSPWSWGKRQTETQKEALADLSPSFSFRTKLFSASFSLLRKMQQTGKLPVNLSWIAVTEMCPVLFYRLPYLSSASGASQSLRSLELQDCYRRWLSDTRRVSMLRARPLLSLEKWEETRRSNWNEGEQSERWMGMRCAKHFGGKRKCFRFLWCFSHKECGCDVPCRKNSWWNVIHI